MLLGYLQPIWVSKILCRLLVNQKLGVELPCDKFDTNYEHKSNNSNTCILLIKVQTYNKTLICSLTCFGKLLSVNSTMCVESIAPCPVCVSNV